jgi:hypothetical protein
MNTTLKRLLPAFVRRWLRSEQRKIQRQMLTLDRVTDFSVLRSVQPHRKNYGWTRGKCVDRYYIEQFLFEHSQDIRGHAVEIGENQYMARFGGDRISKADVLDYVQHPGVTVLADLTSAPNIADATFDCFICTQTLMCLYDLRAAVKTLWRTLASGGVALVTLSGISQIAPMSMTNGANEYWRFTEASAQRLFGEVFGDEQVEVHTFGNVLTAVAFLHGLVVDELTPEEFAYHDPAYPLIVAVRAMKARSSGSLSNG